MVASRIADEAVAAWMEPLGGDLVSENTQISTVDTVKSPLIEVD